ncbi:MAG: DUF3298 domain-containing protein [Oscillibacter sp.]|nr:DUF3298 domain-containing protein [Oscillibacter sp.]
MRKKKPSFRAGLLAALLALSLLAGCGGTPAGNVSKSAPDAAPEVTTEPEIEEIPVAFRPALGLTTDVDYHYDDDLSAVVNRMETQLPGADAETRENYPELAAALDRFRENAVSIAREGFEERESMLSEIMEDGGGNYELYGDMRTLIRRADAQAVSVVNAWTEYAGGVHESYGYAVSNFDTSTGAEITLESLLTPEGAITLNSRLEEELDAVYPDLAPGYMVADYLTDDYTFSLEPDGVTFWFNPYEIASFADGLLTVKLYFDRDADILNDTYKGADESWFVELGDSVPYRYAASDGSFHTAEAWAVRNPEYPDWFDGFGLEFDGPTDSDRWIGRPSELPLEETLRASEGRNIVLNNTGFFSFEVYYAHIPAGDYAVINLSMEDDSREIIVYRADGTLVQTMDMTGPGYFTYPEPPEDADEIDWENYDSYRLALTNPENTPLNTRSDLFGTWNPGGNYRLTGNGFQLQGELLYGSGFTLTLKQDLTVTRQEPDEWTLATDTQITIPAGTEVDTVAVNPEQTAAYFRVPNPSPLTGDDKEFIFALSYDNDEWPRTVNGVDENELFDGLMYAG